jgi:tRNA (adenine57-N1/adenine58-N1)-methyltransferase
LNQKIKIGMYVLLWLDNRRQWLIHLLDKEEFHTHKGIVKTSEIVGKKFGDSVVTTTGHRLYILKPSFYDKIQTFRRPTQILYDKDIGFTLFKLGVEPGMRVIETGTGSGVVTAALANIVKPDGHIYSYEANKDFSENAKSNLSKVGLLEYVTIKCSDARQGFEESEVDAVFLDLGDPWNVIPHAFKSLGDGSNLASFSPTINQVEKAVSTMKIEGFLAIETIELLLRRIRIEDGKSRPETHMVGHTGYLTFARKAKKQEE